MSEHTVDSEPIVASEPAVPKDRSWIRLLCFALFVVVVSGVYAFLMRSAYQPDPKPAFNAVFTDNFDRPRNESSLGEASGGRAWSAVNGLWGIDAGKAVISFPDKQTSIAVVGDVPSAAVWATVSGAARCGIVARFVDDRNYLALERVPKFAVWNLVSMRDGVPTVLGKLPDDGSATVQVKLETGSRVVTAFVGVATLTATDPTDLASGPVGFIGHDNAAAACAWDDLWVFKGN